jgi:hypothetical protein
MMAGQVAFAVDFEVPAALPVVQEAAGDGEEGRGRTAEPEQIGEGPEDGEQSGLIPFPARLESADSIERPFEMIVVSVFRKGFSEMEAEGGEGLSARR